MARHMGTCVAISEDMSTMYAHYPSEPVLAEAAELMKESSNYTIILQNMINHLHCGHIGIFSIICVNFINNITRKWE